MANGIVTWFDPARGFGFLSRAGFVSRPGGDTQIFVDRSQINTESGSLTKGDHVRFSLGSSERGLQALDVSAA
jgi:cold shock protein